MSKSMKRVKRALEEAGIETEIRELGQAKTAQQAAAGVGCALNNCLRRKDDRVACNGLMRWQQVFVDRQ